jgi:acyl carrier protein
MGKEDTLDREMLLELISQVLGEIQEASGREPKEVTEETVLTRDLEGFDSVNAVEACAILCDRLSRLGVEKDLQVETFLSDGNSPASVATIISAVLAADEE